MKYSQQTIERALSQYREVARVVEKPWNDPSLRRVMQVLRQARFDYERVERTGEHEAQYREIMAILKAGR